MTAYTLDSLLLQLLWRFWIHNIAFAGEKEKTFLEISFHASRRDFVRFLWFEEPGNIDFENFENNGLNYDFAEFCLGSPPARSCYFPQLFIT